jgi:hypothetical protein
MQKGLSVMLRSFGIDPEEIKRQLFTAAESLKQTVERFDARLTAIEHAIIELREEIHDIQLVVKTDMELHHGPGNGSRTDPGTSGIGSGEPSYGDRA